MKYSPPNEENTLAGDFQRWSPQWRWRYGFSHYTTGRLLRRALRLKSEIRDRTMARIGPHSRLPSLEISGGSKNLKKLRTKITEIFIQSLYLIYLRSLATACCATKFK